MNMNETILGSIEPEVADRLAKSGEEIAAGRTTHSNIAAGLAMASVPIALAALSRDAFGQTTSTVTDVLNFALMLEIFENEFYKAVLGKSSSTAQNNAFATVRAMVPAAALPTFAIIQQHETSHVAYLQSAGATNILNLTADSFDFTGGQGSGTGPFAGAASDLNFLLLVAQGAEDTGVRAYKGQAPNLMSNPTALESALRIHSVEARHASKIRRLRRQNGATNVKYSGTITGDSLAAAGADNISSPPAGAVAGLTAIYAGEGNTTQLNINISGLANLPTTNINIASAATEAFDEPLTRAQVVAIVQPFFKVTLS
ncbi:MAG: ferritin-like domain-containing protein [Gemmatimonadaceae bacterium]